MRLEAITYKVYTTPTGLAPDADEYAGVVGAWVDGRWWVQRCWVAESAVRETSGSREGLRRFWPGPNAAAAWLVEQFNADCGGENYGEQ